MHTTNIRASLLALATLTLSAGSANADTFLFKQFVKGISVNAGIASAPEPTPPEPTNPPAPEAEGLAGGGWRLAWEADKLNVTQSDAKVWRPAIAAELAVATEAMVAYVDTTTRELSNPHMFAFPSDWRSTHPLAAPNLDAVVTVTNLSTGQSGAGTLRYGTGDWSGSFCSSSWVAGGYGRFCINGAGSAPFYSGFHYAANSSDQCSVSNAAYNNNGCTPTQRFVIYVR